MAANYLAAEALLIERLHATVSGVRKIYSAAELAGVEEQAQTTPALHVVYSGDVLDDSAARGRGQVVAQEWLVVTAVRNARDQQGGVAAREDAGPLLTQVIEALSGWSPGPGFDPLRRINAPRPAYRPGGYAYFPLGFSTKVITQGVAS